MNELELSGARDRVKYEIDTAVQHQDNHAELLAALLSLSPQKVEDLVARLDSLEAEKVQVSGDILHSLLIAEETSEA